MQLSIVWCLSVRSSGAARAQSCLPTAPHAALPPALGRLMLFMGISRTSAFVVSESSDVSEPKVNIKNPAFLLLKKEHRQNTRDY